MQSCATSPAHSSGLQEFKEDDHQDIKTLEVMRRLVVLRISLDAVQIGEARGSGGRGSLHSNLELSRVFPVHQSSQNLLMLRMEVLKQSVKCIYGLHASRISKSSVESVFQAIHQYSSIIP